MSDFPLVAHPLPIDCSADWHHSSTYSDSCGESGGDNSSNPPESPLYNPTSQSHIPPSYQLAAQGKGRDGLRVSFQHQPYCNATHAHHQDREQHMAPVHQQAAHPSDLPFPDCCFHRSLADRLEFIQAPAVESCGVATLIGPCYRLFIGQLRFETTAAEIRWLVQYLTGVTALKVELRGMGCCMAYFRTEAEIKRVCELRYRILFDHTGVWFARDVEQMDYLQAYVGYQVSQIHRGFRLPKDMMVIEEEKFLPYQPRRSEVSRPPQKHFHPAPQPQYPQSPAGPRTAAQMLW